MRRPFHLLLDYYEIENSVRQRKQKERRFPQIDRGAITLATAISRGIDLMGLEETKLNVIDDLLFSESQMVSGYTGVTTRGGGGNGYHEVAGRMGRGLSNYYCENIVQNFAFKCFHNDSLDQSQSSYAGSSRAVAPTTRGR